MSVQRVQGGASERRHKPCSVANHLSASETAGAYLKQLGDLLTPEMAGSARTRFTRADPVTSALGHLLTAAGLQKLP